ncbi:MAG TPA: hypothetical protein VLV55_11890 [Rhizomicrobium sp.]|nr:hypothetical protein [Rhizomicrobium sp.]
MRTVVMGAVFAIGFISAGSAEDVMAPRYGNTTITTDADGSKSKLYYKADGTFTGKRGIIEFGGTWKLEGGNVCLTFNLVLPGMQNPTCAPVAAHKVGDTWTAAGRTVTLVQGIQ